MSELGTTMLALKAPQTGERPEPVTSITWVTFAMFLTVIVLTGSVILLGCRAWQ